MSLADTAQHVEKRHADATNKNEAIVDSVEQKGASNSSHELITLSPVEQLKATISFRALVQSDGQVVKQTGQCSVCRCPFHPDRTPSFSIIENDAWAKCFGCDWKGDIFNYVMSRTGCDFRTAYQHLAQFPTLHGTRTKQVPLGSKAVQPEYQFTERDLKEIEESTAAILNGTERCNRIAASRGWKPETIQALAAEKSLGWGGDCLDFIYETGIKVRKWPGKELYWWAGKPYVWRSRVMKNASAVYLTEGETDAITLLDAGLETDPEVAVVAAPSASTFEKQWAELFRGKDVVLCYDADQAGEKGISRVGVKNRRRYSAEGSVGGSTNTVSERFISRAIFCISQTSRPSASGITATGFPPKTVSVKTSA